MNIWAFLYGFIVLFGGELFIIYLLHFKGSYKSDNFEDIRKLLILHDNQMKDITIRLDQLEMIVQPRKQEVIIKPLTKVPEDKDLDWMKKYE